MQKSMRKGLDEMVLGTNENTNTRESTVKSLSKDVSTLLQCVADMGNNLRLYLIIDELDSVDTEDGITFEWIPPNLSRGKYFIISMEFQYFFQRGRSQSM